MCQDILKDYLWSYIVVTDIPTGILVSFGVYGDLGGQNVVEDMPKILIFESNI